MHSRPEVRRLRVVVAEIEEEGRYLLTQRRENAVFPLLWEFPGGRVEAGEADEAALARALMERMGLPIEVQGLSMQAAHDYETYVVELCVYRARALGIPRALRVHDFAWVSPESFEDYTFPPADRAAVAQLLGIDAG